MYDDAAAALIDSCMGNTVCIYIMISLLKQVNDDNQICKKENESSNKNKSSEAKQKTYLNDKHQENEHQNITMGEKESGQGYTEVTENMNEELAKQSKELIRQYKDMYESELKKRLKIEDQLREADKEKLDTVKQLLEKERSEVAQLKSQLTAGCEKQAIQQKDLIVHESNQVTQLKLNDNEKALYYKELNARDEIYEKRITKVSDTFNRQLKDSEETYKEELLLMKEEVKKSKHFEEAHKKQINDLQLRIEALKEEKVKRLEDSEEAHRRELNNVKLKIEEIKKNEAKKLEDIEKAHKNKICNLQVIVEELKQKLKQSEAAQRKEINNVTVIVEKLKREERVKKLEESLNQQQMLNEALKKETEKMKKDIEKIKKEDKELMEQVNQTNKSMVRKEDIISRLKNHEKSCNMEIQAKLAVFEKRIQDLQLELDKRNHYLKQQLPPKDITEVTKNDVKPTTEHKTHEKKYEEQIKQYRKKHKQDKGSCASRMVEEKAKDQVLFKDFTKTVSMLFSDGSASSEPLDPDVLALMKKTETYQHPALSYDVEMATIKIYCSDPTEREKIKENLFTAYRELLMSDKLKEHALSINDVQEADVIVKECTATFNHTYFKYNSEKKEIRCLSTDAQEMQNVKTILELMKQNFDPIQSTTLNPSYSHALTQEHGRTKYFPSNPQLHPSETPKQLSTHYRKITGNQPSGGIMVTTVKQLKLSGYEKYSTIQINYQIPSGKQGKEHPNPGQPYHGTSQTAYIPNSPTGRKVVKLLRKAFDARMIFTIGASPIAISGATNVVVWSDIPHTTNTRGGPPKSVTAAVF